MLEAKDTVILNSRNTEEYSLRLEQAEKTWPIAFEEGRKARFAADSAYGLVAMLEQKRKDGKAEGILKGRKEVGQLAIQILNFAEHGDYSNGNESQGSDEGRYLAGLAIADFRKQLKEWRIEA